MSRPVPLWIRFSGIILLYALFLFQNIRLCENFHGKFGAAGVIWADAYCYYEYLPGAFIQGDVKNLKMGMQLEPGVKLSKVTYGVALLESPFFFGNYAIQSMRGDVGTGFENSYGYSILIANTTYAFLGLTMVFLLFRKWFNTLTAVICIIGIYYGTNMFHYSYAGPGVSHVYSFFCASGLLFFTDRFYQNPVFGKNLIVVTIFMALIVIIRPVNVVMILIFALYNCYTWADFKARLIFLFSKRWIIPVFAAVGLLFLLPQMFYWELITGKWFVSPYTEHGESFIYLAEPKIMEALFSHKGGWFPYAQIMLISIGALPFMIWKRRFHGWMILIVFLVILYICSSWWAINFMCAHGYRSFIDYYAIFIIPFAWLYYNILTKTRIWISIPYTLAMLLLIYFACRMNLEWSGWLECEADDWMFYDYIKWYDDFI